MVAPDDVTEGCLSYLQAHRVITLATQGRAGLWAAAVFYASEQFELYFLSAPNTRHALNLADTPRAAGTIHEDYANWRVIKGIQLEGPVQHLRGVERRAAVECYARKFPFLRNAPEAIVRALQGVEWFSLVPDRLYFIDNDRGFGHRDRIL